MTLPSSTAFENVWGLALLVFGLLLPRLYLRATGSSALGALNQARLPLGYLAAISASLSLVAIAPLLGVWSWVYAIPSPGALQLMQRQVNYEYVFGALVAWLFVSHFVAPVAAWLASRDRLNLPALVLGCACLALALGGLAALAWPKPTQVITLTVASALCLALASSLAFALALRLPVSPTSSAASAA